MSNMAVRTDFKGLTTEFVSSLKQKYKENVDDAFVFEC